MLKSRCAGGRSPSVGRAPASVSVAAGSEATMTLPQVSDLVHAGTVTVPVAATAAGHNLKPPRALLRSPARAACQCERPAALKPRRGCGGSGSGCHCHCHPGRLAGPPAPTIPRRPQPGLPVQPLRPSPRPGCARRRDASGASVPWEGDSEPQDTILSGRSGQVTGSPLRAPLADGPLRWHWHAPPPPPPPPLAAGLPVSPHKRDRDGASLPQAS